MTTRKELEAVMAKMRIGNYRNAVEQGIAELGGQSNFAQLLNRHGANVHRQSVYNWTTLGHIPSKYKMHVIKAIDDCSQIMTDPLGFLASIKEAGMINGNSTFPNEPLASWIEANGGVSSFIKRANIDILSKNRVLGKNSVKKWTYVMIHNWLKRGRISDNFRDVMEQAFGCPREIMGPEEKPTNHRKPEPPRPDRIERYEDYAPKPLATLIPLTSKDILG